VTGAALNDVRDAIGALDQEFLAGALLEVEVDIAERGEDRDGAQYQT
jgi:hypothetical protein